MTNKRTSDLSLCEQSSMHTRNYIVMNCVCGTFKRRRKNTLKGDYFLCHVNYICCLIIG